MNDEPSKSKTAHKSQGCLTWTIFFGVLVVVFATLLAFELPRMRERDRLHREQMNELWRQQSFHDVKNGDSRGFVMVPGLLSMFANDADCVANLELLEFAIVEITPDDAQHVARLSNVKKMSFYDTRGADYVLEHYRDLPIEQLRFDSTAFSDESLRNFADFPKLKEVHFEQLAPEKLVLLTQVRPDLVITIDFPSEREPAREK